MTFTVFLAWAAMLVFWAGAFADTTTTIMVLKRGGMERNPLLGWVFSKVGVVAGMVTTKLVPITAVTYFYIATPHAFIYICTLIAGLAMLYVGWLNFKVWRGQV